MYVGREYIKKLNTWNTGGATISTFSTLLTAKDACDKDTNCFLVYDQDCDGDQYKTEARGTLVTSTTGSCVWVKPGTQ